jgi:hypothetical protein
MTPKEKAKELVDKYDFLQDVVEGFNFYDSKQCALIAVDEILWLLNHNQIDTDYYKEVKQEIEKL